MMPPPGGKGLPGSATDAMGGALVGNGGKSNAGGPTNSGVPGNASATSGGLASNSGPAARTGPAGASDKRLPQRVLARCSPSVITASPLGSNRGFLVQYTRLPRRYET